MNQMSQITVPLEILFALGDAPDPNNADSMVIALQVARRYPFLPQPVFIEVERDRIILNYPAAPDHAKAEAKRLAQRAPRHAGNGDCQRAIAIWEEVLQLVPDELLARRDIGMACSELGDLMFRGTAYKAAGWMLLGPTAGFGRCAEDFYQRHDRPKQLWVRVLDPEGTAALKAQSLPRRLAPYEPAAQPRPLSGKPLLSLLDRLPAVREPRSTHGRRHPWPAILGIVCLAKLAGVAGSQRDIAEFAKRFNQTQRRQLSCYRNPKTGLREAPSQSTFFRALKAVSYDALEPLLVGWQDDLLGPADPKELVVLDGKVARAAGGQMGINAVTVPGRRMLGVEVVRTKD
jgi:hypothetical protein